ncbi:MAG TPA: flagellar motor switch protein FliN [Acidisarcina sp.]
MSESPGSASGAAADQAQNTSPGPQAGSSTARSTGDGDASIIAFDETQDAANLNLVMDVELNVTLRFGQRSLSLREVLDLSSGSVIELDRQVDDPVELLLDGRVIARGEAVVIDGHYGLRVTEIPRPYIHTPPAGGERGSR